MSDDNYILLAKDLAEAERFESLGFYGDALGKYDLIVNSKSISWTEHEHKFLYDKVKYKRRKLYRNILQQLFKNDPWIVIDRDKDLNKILPFWLPIKTEKIFDPNREIVAKKALLIPALRSEYNYYDEEGIRQEIEYCKKAFYEGASLVVYLPNDEWYQYSRNIPELRKYCDLIITHFYHEGSCYDNKVMNVPLFWRSNDFFRNISLGEIPTSEDRKFVWSFIGDIKKSKRNEMIEAMRQVAGGFEHITDGWAAANELSPGNYRDIFDQSIFIPCPAGWINLDSFRVYEALEAGCIPIVEKRPYFDYFKLFLGDHPMLTIDDWKHAPDIINSFTDKHAIEQRRLSCQTWWLNYKDRLNDLLKIQFDSELPKEDYIG